MISISILTSSPDYSLVAKKMCTKYPIFSIVYAGNDHLDLFKRKNIYLTDVLILDVNYEILSLGKLINKIKDSKTDTEKEIYPPRFCRKYF